MSVPSKEAKVGEGAGSKVRDILDSYKDVLSKKFPTGLPPRRGVDHNIELILGSIPSAKAHIE